MDRTFSSQEYVHQYETLRVAALENPPRLRSSFGWIVLARKGMKAWMQVWRDRGWNSPGNSPTQEGKPMEIFSNVQADLTSIVADMIVSLIQEEENEDDETR